MKKTIIAKIEFETELNYELTTYDVELALRKYFPQGKFTVKENAQQCDQSDICPQCGQVPNGQGGEYPCPACGVPTLHDS